MSSSSNIQQGISEMISNLQLRNELEGEHITQLTSIQENLSKINQLIREKMLLDKKSIKDLEDIDKMLEERNERYEEELRLKKEIIEKELIEKKIAEENEKRQKAMAEIKKAAWIGAAAGAVSALGTTITTVFKAGKIVVEAFVDVMKKVGEAAFNIGKSLLMLPWNMFKSLVSAAANAQGSTELLDRIEDIRKEWGSFSNAMSADVLKASTLGINLKQGAVAQMQFYKETLAPGRSMMRVWQSLPEMMKDITKTLSSLGPTINLVMNQFSNPETFKSIVAMKKGLGLADDEFKALAEHTMANGKKIEDSMYEIGNLSLQLGDKFGLSSKKISSDVGKMMKDLGNFGNLTEKQMTAAATQFNRLGVEVSKVTGMMDKFDQFEEAADASSKLSQAFGLQVDSMELMRAEDPAQRQQMLADAMNRAGLSTDGMRRQSLKLLATTMGLDAATTKTMFSSANLGKSYDEVKNAADEASKKQLSQEEVLKRLADAIEKVNRTGNQLKDGFFKTFLDGIEKGIQRTPSYINMMTNLRRGLHATLWEGIGTGESITKTLGLDEAFNAIGNHFSKENMTKFFGKNGMRGVIEKIFDKNATKQTIDEQFDHLLKLFTDQKDGLMSKIYPQLQRLGDVFGRIGQLIITKIGEAIGKAFKGGASILKGDDLGKSLGDEFQKSPWGRFIMPVWEGLKSAFLSMFDGFAEIAPVLLEKAIKTITWIFKGIQYLLSSKEQRKLLDASSATGSYLGMGGKKGPAATQQEKMFDDSMNKLSSGISAVFNDEKLWDPLKKAAWGAFERIKDYLLIAWEYVSPYITKLFTALFVTKAITGAISGAIGMAIQQRMMAAAVTQGLGAAGVGTTGAVGTTVGTTATGGFMTSMFQSAGGLLKGAAEGIGGVAERFAFGSAATLVGFVELANYLNQINGEDKLAVQARKQEIVDTQKTITDLAVERDKIKSNLDLINSVGNNLSENDKQIKTSQETLLKKYNDTIAAQQKVLDDKKEADKIDSVKNAEMESTKGGWGERIYNWFQEIKKKIKVIPEKAFEGLMSGLSWIEGLLNTISEKVLNTINLVKDIILKIGGVIAGLLNNQEWKEKFDEAQKFDVKKMVAVGINYAVDRATLGAEQANNRINFEDMKRGPGMTGLDRFTYGITGSMQEERNRINQNAINQVLGNLDGKTRDLYGKESKSEQLQFLEASGYMQNESAKKIANELVTKMANLKENQAQFYGADGMTIDTAKIQATVAEIKTLNQQLKDLSLNATTPSISSQTSTSASATAVANAPQTAQIAQNINDATKAVNEAKASTAANTSNTATISETNSQIAINTGKIGVNLATANKDLMEGINSIRTSTRNVDVRVAVAVELNVRELEQALVSSKDSLIRKAVSIIENNIAPSGAPPRTDEKPGVDGGTIPGKVFGQPK